LRNCSEAPFRKQEAGATSLSVLLRLVLPTPGEELRLDPGETLGSKSIHLDLTPFRLMGLGEMDLEDAILEIGLRVLEV
jgi:hypothetical protein